MNKISINFPQNNTSLLNSLQNQQKGCQVLEILQCPTVSDGYKLISSPCFKEKLKKSQFIEVNLKISENLNERYFKTLQLNSFVIRKPILITFESCKSDNENVIYWKDSKSDEFLSMRFFNGFLKDLVKFVKDFIIECVKNDFPGLIMNAGYKNFNPQIHQLQNINGYNLLIQAIYDENITIVLELLKFPFDINAKNGSENKTAAEIAHEKGNNEILLLLLKANSLFPEKFYVDEVSDEIKDFIESVSKIHEAVIRSNKKTVMKILQENRSIRHFYNISNTSVVAIALRFKKIKIYELLSENNVFIGQNEKINEIIQHVEQNDEPQSKMRKINEDIKIIHDKNAKNLSSMHLMILMSNSCLGHDDQYLHIHTKAVQNAFAMLNSNPLIRPILVAVAVSRNFRIHFDFNRNSIIFLDPKSELHSNGACYYMNSEMYIAVKEITCPEKKYEVLGIIIHELYHYALHLVYRNRCKPYAINDNEMDKEYSKILKRIFELYGQEKLISDVYKYESIQQVAELAVRVPQIIINYSNDPKKLNKIISIFSDIFVDFEQRILPDMMEAIETMGKINSGKFSWNSLTGPMKIKILNSFVNFQGNRVKFNEIIDIDDSDVLQSLSQLEILNLLNDSPIEISKPNTEKSKFYIDRYFINKKQNIKVDLNGIISECEAFKVILLSDQAGSGKSTTFKNIAENLKKRDFKSHWISLIDLKKHLKIYRAYEINEFNLENILNLLIEILKLNKELDVQVFKNLFKNNKAILLWDGVDEISPNFKYFIVNLMTKIRQFTANQQWISTRPQHKELLEVAFQRESYIFAEYDKLSKNQFVHEIFREKFDRIKPEKSQIDKVLKFIENVEKNSLNSISNPLILQMITELNISEHGFKVLNLFSIYDIMIERKKKILNGKGEIPNHDRDINSKLNIWQVHQIYALILIFRTGFVDVTSKDNMFIDLNNFSIMRKWKTQQQKWTPEIISRYGFLIVDNWKSVDKWGISWEFPDFIHRTFAEFFVAKFLIESIYEEDDDEDITESEMEMRLKLLYFVFYNNQFNHIKQFISNFIELQIKNGPKVFCGIISEIVPRFHSHKIFASKFFIQSESVLKSLWHLNDSSNRTLFQDLLDDNSIGFDYIIDAINIADEVFSTDWPKITGFVNSSEESIRICVKEDQNIAVLSNQQRKFVELLRFMEAKFPRSIEMNFMRKYFSEMFKNNFMDFGIFKIVFYRILRLFESDVDEILKIITSIFLNQYNFQIYQDEEFIQQMWDEIGNILDSKMIKKILLYDYNTFDHPLLTAFRIKSNKVREFYINLYKKYCENDEIRKIFLSDNREVYLIQMSNVKIDTIEFFL